MKTVNVGIVLFFSLVGCAQLQNTTSTELSKTIRSPHCIETPYLKVLQVLEEGILANLCPVKLEYPYKDVFEACWKGDLVYLEVPSEYNQFVDEQKLTLTEDMCFVPDGTYRYVTRENVKKTIRKISVMDSRIPNPDLEKSKKDDM